MQANKPAFSFIQFIKCINTIVMEKKMKIKKFEIMLGVCILILVALATTQGIKMAQTIRMTKEKKTVVIDAGHGGVDPGKIGVNQALEKDINLEIAKRVQMYLEQNDIHVIMTRDSDDALYDADSKNKKVQDLKRRMDIIEGSGAEFTISIHQNSYHDEGCKGAQVFYHGKSVHGKELAECLQSQLIAGVDPDNNRVAKANNSYYLLKETGIPTAIVECGFLSNWEESVLLIEEDYQDKLAWNIAMGIIKCLNLNKE